MFNVYSISECSYRRVYNNNEQKNIRIKGGMNVGQHNK